MNGTLVVAIDGPSGSGKSSVSRAVAQALGIGYLDTGAMYRALTWWCLHTGVDLDDADAAVRAAHDLPLDLDTDPRSPGVRVDGVDIAAAIRTAEVTTAVTKVATNAGVRPVLQADQRRRIAAIAQQWGGVVAEGRDLTTVVAPTADVRILLTASEQARLRRRSTELHGAADASAMAATRDQIVSRDRADATVSQFAVAAPGVVTVDTSDLDFDGSVAAVLAVVARARE